VFVVVVVGINIWLLATSEPAAFRYKIPAAALAFILTKAVYRTITERPPAGMVTVTEPAVRSASEVTAVEVIVAVPSFIALVASCAAPIALLAMAPVPIEPAVVITPAVTEIP